PCGSLQTAFRLCSGIVPGATIRSKSSDATPVRRLHARLRHAGALAQGKDRAHRTEGVSVAGDADPGPAEGPVEGRAPGSALAEDLRLGAQPCPARRSAPLGHGGLGQGVSVYPDGPRIRLRLFGGGARVGPPRRPLDVRLSL